MNSFPRLPLPQVDTVLGAVNDDLSVYTGGYDVDLSSGRIKFSPRIENFFRAYQHNVPSNIAEFRGVFLPGQVPPFLEDLAVDEGGFHKGGSQNFTGAMRLNSIYFQSSHSYCLDEGTEDGQAASGRAVRVFIRIRETSWLNPQHFSVALMKVQKDAREALQRLFAVMEVGERGGLVLPQEAEFCGHLGDNFVVDALLESFLGGPQPEPEIEVFDLGALLRGVAGRVHDRAGLSRIRLRVGIGRCENVLVRGDRLSVARALNALLQDALTASRAGDKVLLLGRPVGDKVGIHILRKRGSESHGPRALAALRCADIGSGSISLKTFNGEHAATLELPLVPNLHGPSYSGLGTRLDLRTHQPPSKKLKVLIAEDEPEILSVIGQLLRRSFDVIEVGENWLEFLDSFPITETPPDVLLVDFHLAADITGLDVLERARALWGIRTPAICVTAIDERLDPEAHRHLATLRERGIAVYRKPVRTATLIEAIKAAYDAAKAGL